MSCTGPLLGLPKDQHRARPLSHAQGVFLHLRSYASTKNRDEGEVQKTRGKVSSLCMYMELQRVIPQDSEFLSVLDMLIAAPQFCVPPRSNAMVTVLQAVLLLLAILLVVQSSAQVADYGPEGTVVLMPRLRRNALMFSKLHRQQTWPFISDKRYEYPKRLVVNALFGRDRIR
uniref:Neuropeptide-Like Protein n=1 Tax=Steinernema glaseri TaxID=37863 RepID=A0A1I7YDU1_9BILA